jgi:hypothetical protein
MIVVQDSIAASSSFGSNSNWSLLSVGSNSSPFQQAGASSYPSFNETLSNLQAEMEPELQNETLNGNSFGSQQFQSETFQPSVSATEQPYYGNPTLTNSPASNFTNWRTNSQSSPYYGGSAGSAASTSSIASNQQPQPSNNSQPSPAASTNSLSDSGPAPEAGESADSDKTRTEDGSGESKLKSSSVNGPDRSQTDTDNSADKGNQDSLKQSSPAIGGSDNASSGLEGRSKRSLRQEAGATNPKVDGTDSLVQSASRDLHLAGGDKVDSSTLAEAETHLLGSHSAYKPKQGKTSATDKGTTKVAAPGDTSASTGEASADLSTRTLGLTPKTSAGTVEPGNSTLSSVSPGPSGAVSGKDSSKDLAFAVKVEANPSSASDGMTPSDSAPAQGVMADGVTSSPFVSELKTLLASSGQGGNENRGSGDGGAPAGGLAPVSSMAPASSKSSTAGETTVSQQDAAAAAEGVQDKTAGTQSLRSVQIRVTGDDNQQVDLRLMQRSGALTVSVRSTDTSLTKALQQNLPDLSSKLNDQQVRTEWWTPNAHKVETSQKTGESSANTGSGQSGSQNQSGQNKGNAGQQGGRDAPKPDWVEQLSEPGNSNKNGKHYTWHL